MEDSSPWTTVEPRTPAGQHTSGAARESARAARRVGVRSVVHSPAPPVRGARREAARGRACWVVDRAGGDGGAFGVAAAWAQSCGAVEAGPRVC